MKLVVFTIRMALFCCVVSSHGANVQTQRPVFGPVDMPTALPDSANIPVPQSGSRDSATYIHEPKASSVDTEMHGDEPESDFVDNAKHDEPGSSDTARSNDEPRSGSANTKVLEDEPRSGSVDDAGPDGGSRSGSEDFESHDRWDRTMSDAEWIKDGLLGPYLPQVLEAASTSNASDPCLASIEAFSRGLDDWEPWAIKMADASAKIPSGLLMGKVIDLGSFDECLSLRRSSAVDARFCLVGHSSSLVDSTRRERKRPYVQLHGEPPAWIADYLSIHPVIEQNRTFYLGVCLPSACSEEDFYKLFYTVSSPFGLDVNLSDCQVEEPKELTTNRKLALCFLAFLLALCVSGSLYDWFFPAPPKELAATEGSLRRVVRVWCVRARARTLQELSQRESPLDAFHGMRVVCTFAMLFTHSYMFPDRWSLLRYTNFFDFRDLISGSWKVLLDNVPFVLEVFIIISGFILSYTLWSKMESNGGYLNLKRFFLKKALKTYVSLLFLVSLGMVAPMLSSGPIWNSTWGEEVRKCEGWLWSNFLFFNNYLDPVFEQCFLHTWFLSCLMQCYAVGVVLLLVSFRWRKTGVLLGVVLSAGCSCYMYFKVLEHKLGVPSIFRHNDILNFTRVAHLFSHLFVHLPSYLIGMWTGFAALKHPHPSSRVQWIGWTSSLLLATGAFVWVEVCSDDSHAVALYSALSRIFFSFSVAWLLYACATGHAVTLSSVLSKRPLVVLSILCSQVYLLHPLVLLLRGAHVRERVFYSHLDSIFLLATLVPLTLGMAYVAHICVEQPFEIVIEFLVGSETRRPDGETPKSDAASSETRNETSDATSRATSNENSDAISNETSHENSNIDLKFKKEE